jgi:hypothetical protein
MMHAAAAMHSATAAMRSASAMAVAAAVARSPAANLKEQTVVQPRGGGARSVHFDGFGLRRREAQQCCDRDPSADRSESSHGGPPLRGVLKMAAFVISSHASRFRLVARGRSSQDRLGRKNPRRGAQP